jgi:hypothetical protein
VDVSDASPSPEFHEADAPPLRAWLARHERDLVPSAIMVSSPPVMPRSGGSRHSGPATTFRHECTGFRASHRRHPEQAEGAVRQIPAVC